MKHRAVSVVVPVIGAVTAAGLLTGCGSSGSGSSAGGAASTPASAAASPTATSTAAAFNPCSSLDAAKISKVLGATVKINLGTADTPRCALVPAKKGDPAFELSYLWFDGGLEAAWKTITDKPVGTITAPKVAGADDAKLIVQRKKSAYADSAFLQNGTLIQSLNGLALAPYDAKAMRRATTEILTELSAGAPER